MKSRLVVVACVLYGILVTCDCSLASDVDAGVLHEIQQRYQDIPVIAVACR